ncbi:hypothetical protein, partial [Azorhizophilus paspali]
EMFTSRGNVIPHRGNTTPRRGSDGDHQRQQCVTLTGLELVKKQPKRWVLFDLGAYLGALQKPYSSQSQ